MEGLTELENIKFSDKQIKLLKDIVVDASPKSKMAYAIFGSNNNIDLGLSKLATTIKGFEVELLIGDPMKGKKYSKSCVGCHGKNFSGLISERSPSLPQLSNWYMQGQLQKYKQNLRNQRRLFETVKNDVLEHNILDHRGKKPLENNL